MSYSTNHIRRILDSITAKNLTKIFSTVHYGSWLAEWKGVICIRELSLDRCQLIHLHLKRITLCTNYETNLANAGKIKWYDDTMNGTSLQ